MAQDHWLHVISVSKELIMMKVFIIVMIANMIYVIDAMVTQFHTSLLNARLFMEIDKKSNGKIRLRIGKLI